MTDDSTYYKTYVYSTCTYTSGEENNINIILYEMKIITKAFCSKHILLY